jgi:hypothetical protein
MPQYLNGKRWKTKQKQTKIFQQGSTPSNLQKNIITTKTILTFDTVSLVVKLLVKEIKIRKCIFWSGFFVCKPIITQELQYFDYCQAMKVLKKCIMIMNNNKIFNEIKVLKYLKSWELSDNYMAMAGLITPRLI